ncbi:MAG: hypothetical protein BM557_03275 [Flavobacterium sp. MedPE-SWcel]|uniref:hypothetical protein n=1 Tax=uncultured Flavobacterium sp. TaxID=165435 RepID=UPI000916D97F|nr:hypothetical protein [uncultured Flavobacterium sp.]OIQ21829.1 MAG: hypothetical protein BM557_03275 [Flavobacterium sp. MedPE-SWcel]
MKNIITLLLLFTALTVTAKDYYKAKILFLDKTIKEGYAELPSNKTFDNSIKFQETKKGKKTKYKFNKIDQIIYYTDSGNEYLFERRKRTMLYGSKENIKSRTPKKKHWFLVVFSNPIISYYYSGDTYSINNRDHLITKISDGGTWASVNLSLKRQNEENPTLIGAFNYGAHVFGTERRFRKHTAHYFKDSPELVKRIQNKEFKIKDIVKLLEVYIQYKVPSEN